jgi:hypothetical protein
VAPPPRVGERWAAGGTGSAWGSVDLTIMAVAGVGGTVSTCIGALLPSKASPQIGLSLSGSCNNYVALRYFNLPPPD